MAIGLVADEVFGEPPNAAHPVVWFGRGMTRLERSVYADSRGRGSVFWVLGVGGGVLVGVGLARLAGPHRATVVATWAAVASRMLGREAEAIADVLGRGDLLGARQRLPALVGRSPDDLDEHEIARAVIESVAENAVDAVVAPALWALVGGAPAVLGYRAVNTLDAMVGHHSSRYERFGWASARADDIANWIPARASAVLVALLRPNAAAAVLRTIRRDAGQHPSPNGGVVESAFAANLGVRLGGQNRYGDRIEDRGTLGDGPAPTASDIAAAVRLLRQLTAFVGVVAVVPAAVRAVRGTVALREARKLQCCHATRSR